MSGGLLQMSGVVVDFVHYVKRLPASGEEVEAESASLMAGGGFNAVAAARRLGVAVAYGGALGLGPFADIARAALEREGVRLLQSSPADIDQGVCVVLVDPQGERSFITRHGAERAITAAALAAIPAAEYDWVLLSGYSLYHPRCADAFAAWLAALPRGPRFLFDPGPVVAEIAQPRSRRRAGARRVGERQPPRSRDTHRLRQSRARRRSAREGARRRARARGRSRLLARPRIRRSRARPGL